MAVVECPCPCPSESECVSLLNTSSLIRIFPSLWCVCLHWVSSKAPCQSKPLHWFHWEWGQKPLMNSCVFMLRISSSGIGADENTTRCFHAFNGTGIGNLILQTGNKGYFSYMATLILMEQGNSLVKSFIRTCSNEWDLSENDWSNSIFCKFYQELTK